ncbi:MAG: trimeric intracellular cation channel family protein [Pseudomonadota bacterium]
MTTASLLALLDYAGVFVFALSGGLTAVRHRLDLFGVAVVALLPAVGGGTVRDLLLDAPVFWLENEAYVALAAGAGVAAFAAPRFWSKLKVLVWFDALGLALFAVVGAAKAYALGHGALVVVIMGTITATFGGLIRDVVCNETPMLLREEIYATAALAGAGVYWLSRDLGATNTAGLLIGGGVAFAIRWAAIVFKLSAPKPPAWS